MRRCHASSGIQRSGCGSALVEEEGFTGSYDSVARWIKRYRLEHRRPGEGFSELAWSPRVAQVDYRQAIAMIDGQRIVTHERVYDTHTDTVIDPVRIVPGLIRRPRALRQSLIRPYMPQSLLDYLNHADLAEQRRIWQIIDRACKEADFTTVSSIITGMLEADKNIDKANVVMAVKAGSQRPTLTTIVDLSAYDQIMKKRA